MHAQQHDRLFLGAVYLAAVPLIGALLLVRRRSLARLVLPTSLVFTATLLLVSLAYLERFYFDRWATWLWFGLYVVFPLNALYHLWLYRDSPAAGGTSTPVAWRAYLAAQSAVLGLYAAAMLAVPERAAAFWP